MRTTTNFYDESMSKQTDIELLPFSKSNKLNLSKKLSQKDKSRVILPQGKDIYKTLNQLIQDSN